MTKRWYVIHAFSGFEGQVQRSLKERIARAHMEELFGDILVPIQEVTEMKNGKRATVKRKFLPGYVLVEMEMTSEARHVVANTPGVTGFVGVRGGQTPEWREKEHEEEQAGPGTVASERMQSVGGLWDACHSGFLRLLLRFGLVRSFRHPLPP